LRRRPKRRHSLDVFRNDTDGNSEAASLSPQVGCAEGSRAIMDVLHTNIVVVDGRRYRVQSDAGEPRSDRRDDPGETPVAADAPSVVRDASPADGSTSRAASGEWLERVSVDADLAKRALGGPSGAARRALERDTGARVVLPGETPEEEAFDAPTPVANRGEALVVAPTADRAAAGRAVFESLLRSALEAPSTPHTHFVGVPLNADALVDAARAFRAECLTRAARVGSNDRSSSTLEFAEPGRLRLAFFELKLCGDDARAAAADAMKRAEEDVSVLKRRWEEETGTSAVSFSLRGAFRGFRNDDDDALRLETRDDARLASIRRLFAAAFRDASAIAPSSFFFADHDRRIDAHRGGATDDDGDVISHVEVARWPNGAAAADADAEAFFRDVFDARDFGRVDVEEVRLSKSREFDVALGGYFKCVQSVELTRGNAVVQ
jgi:hypothetical protein